MCLSGFKSLLIVRSLSVRSSIVVFVWIEIAADCSECLHVYSQKRRAMRHTAYP